eukprot:TRINITY_DN1718_c0_g2_i1.p1 TRINITY_DN1718_c0_g2~~TRINITY_DN1718_c0_g2_i1.p1  ORF type:complete len:271 (-),score=30.50 TRINITY_DN1718_c0_g2_i1:282-1049(-)
MAACKRPYSFGSKDMNAYRTGYFGKRDDLTRSDNLLFHSNSLRSRPDGLLISEMHEQWAGDFDTLESRHGYIQWLFPLQTASGANGASQELFVHEAEAIRANGTMRARVWRSFEIMLEFYGHSYDATSGQFSKSTNFAARSANLNSNTHNNLRISRILKSLGELGFEDIKLRWLEFWISIIDEQPNQRSSLREFWSESLRKPDELQSMRKQIAKMDPYYSSSVDPSICNEKSICSSSSELVVRAAFCLHSKALSY